MAVPDLGQLISTIFTTLNSDGTLTALLGTYDPVSGAVPSIFSGNKVPSSASAPFISIRPVVGLTPFDTIDTRGLTVDVDIAIYSDDEESGVELQNIIDRVLELLHRSNLSLGTDDLIINTLIGLTSAPTDPELSGAVLSFQFTVMKSG